MVKAIDAYTYQKPCAVVYILYIIISYFFHCKGLPNISLALQLNTYITHRIKFSVLTIVFK